MPKRYMPLALVVHIINNRNASQFGIAVVQTTIYTGRVIVLWYMILHAIIIETQREKR